MVWGKSSGQTYGKYSRKGKYGMKKCMRKSKEIRKVSVGQTYWGVQEGMEVRRM